MKNDKTAMFIVFLLKLNENHNRITINFNCFFEA